MALLAACQPRGGRDRSYEQLCLEWRDLTNAWRDEQAASPRRAMKDLGSVRDDNAARILRQVSSDLECLRLALMRKEDASGVRERLHRSRMEWQAFVVAVKPPSTD